MNYTNTVKYFNVQHHTKRKQTVEWNKSRRAQHDKEIKRKSGDKLNQRQQQ